MHGWTLRMTEEGRPSTAQDVIKGRRTEIDAINGLVAELAQGARIEVPYQRALLDLVKRIEQGLLAPDKGNIALLQQVGK
jgi:2-dehydropantoate 2-reductase